MKLTKREIREQTLRNRKLEQSNKLKQLVESWNPLPERGKTLPRLQSTVEKNSNFINCKQRYMNIGKYKGIDIKDVPTSYLKWVQKNITLNQAELNLIKKYIK